MNDKLIIKLPYGEVNAEWYDWLGAGVLTCTLLYGASKLAKRIKKFRLMTTMLILKPAKENKAYD